MFSWDPVLGLEHADGHVGVLALTGGVLPALGQDEEPKQVYQLGSSPALLWPMEQQLPHHKHQLQPLMEQGSGRPGG